MRNGYNYMVQSISTLIGNIPRDRVRLLDRKITVSRLLFAEIPIIIVVNFLVNISIIPSMATYLLDVFNVAVALFSLKAIARLFDHSRWYGYLLLVFAVYGAFMALLNAVDPILFAWEFFQLFRFILFGLLCAAYFRVDDFVRVWRLLYKLQPVNVAFVAYEYIVMGLDRDNLGGIFGTVAGCNGPLNVFLGLCVAYAFVSCLNNRDVGVVGFALTCISCLIIVSLAEIKFFYFEFLTIAVISLFINRPSFKTVGVIIVSIAGIVLALNVLKTVNPYHYSVLMDVNSIMGAADNHDLETGYGVSRIGMFSQMDSMFFHGDIIERFIGMGIGATTMSSISLFCSPFFYANGYLKYYYLQSAMLYLQMGYLGLLFYSIASAGPSIRSLFSSVRSNERLRPACELCACVAVLFLMNCFYENSARTFFSCIWALFLFAPLVLSEHHEARKDNDGSR